jgi:hypothetical protein
VGWKRHPRPIAWLAPVAIAVTVTAVFATAAGARPPPSYALSIGDPMRCGAIHETDTADARRENRRLGPLDLPEGATGIRLLLVGDSSACSLWPGLREVGRANGITMDQASVFGCGVASGEVTTTRGEQVAQHSERCPELVEAALRTMLPKTRPNVIVWMSIWEKSDLVDENGETIVSGTREGDREIMARMDAELQRLTLGRAHVYLVTVPAAAPNDAQGTNNASNEVDDESYRRLARINRMFAERHPDQVTLVDLASRVCPGGPPCPEFVDGERIRPDGRHFTPQAATRYSRWLVGKIATGQT